MKQYFLDIITSWGEEMLQKVFFYIRKHNNKISHESTYQIYVLLSYHCLCIVTIGILAHFSTPISTKFALTFLLPILETLVIKPLFPTHTHTHIFPQPLYTLLSCWWNTHSNKFFQSNSVHICSMEIINKLVKLL